MFRNIILLFFKSAWSFLQSCYAFSFFKMLLTNLISCGHKLFKKMFSFSIQCQILRHKSPLQVTTELSTSCRFVPCPQYFLKSWKPKVSSLWFSKCHQAKACFSPLFRTQSSYCQISQLSCGILCVFRGVGLSSKCNGFQPKESVQSSSLIYYQKYNLIFIYCTLLKWKEV